MLEDWQTEAKRKEIRMLHYEMMRWRVHYRALSPRLRLGHALEKSGNFWERLLVLAGSETILVRSW
jgi:hypothetical protein